MSRKSDFLYQIELKKYAMLFFPEFFGADCSILKTATLKDVREKYLEYCEKYFINSPEGNTKFQIFRGYNYLVSELERKELPLKSETTRNLLKAYEALIAELAEYKFYPRNDFTYRAAKNRNNESILFEISVFKDVFLMVLRKIDFYITDIEEKIESETDKHNEAKIYIELNAKLKNLIAKLNEDKCDLAVQSVRYRYLWLKLNTHRNGYSKQDINKAMKSWHQLRNKACNTILAVHKELESINRDISKRPDNYISKYYNLRFNYVISGPNYYSYLSPLDRETLTKENKLRKRCLSE